MNVQILWLVYFKKNSFFNFYFQCQAYSASLIGGHLCPDLCTTKNIQLQNCLGEHKNFRSRVRFHLI
jgi:hypothetical protein